jgi:restriction system protein
MPVPDYESLMLPLLSALADGEEHEVASLRDRIAASLKLTDADRAELLPSGKQSMFDNRIGWAKFYMDKAGLVVSTRRGVYQVTDLGQKALGQKPARIDGDFLNQFDSFRDFVQREREDDQDEKAAPKPAGAATPEEVLETAYRQIRKKVEADLVAVAKASPRFFEKLVVELLGLRRRHQGRRQGARAEPRRRPRWPHQGGPPRPRRHLHPGEALAGQRRTPRASELRGQPRQ